MSCGRTVLGWVLVMMARTQLRVPLDMNAEGFELLPEDALRHASAQFLNRKSHTAFLRERDDVETHTLPTPIESSALTAVLKLLAVDGTSISLSAFIWAFR